MAASDMRNRRHVQPLLTWSTNAAHPPPVEEESCQSMDQEDVGSPDPSGLSVSRSEEDGQTCTICFEPWSNSSEHRLVSLRCGHLFGHSCIDKWLRGAGSKCPQCNTPARRSDIRQIFAKCLKVLDTTERDRALWALEREKELRRRSDLEAAQCRLQLHMVQNELRQLQAEVKELRSYSTRMEEQMKVHKLEGSTQPANFSQVSVGVKFDLVKYMEFPKTSSLRVVSGSQLLGMLVVSQHSANPLFPGYGFKKVQMLDLRQLEFVPLHSKAIKDMAFHPTSNLILTAALDKTSKLTDSLSNVAVQMYVLVVSPPWDISASHCLTLSPPWDHPNITKNYLRLQGVLGCPLSADAWSCMWSRRCDSQFYVGLSNGVVLHFDSRHCTEPVAEIRVPGVMSPVVALQYISRSQPNAEFEGGPVVCHLSSCHLVSDSPGSEPVIHTLPINGNLTSANYEPRTGHLLVSSRPTPRQPRVSHLLFQLGPGKNCSLVQKLHGGATQVQLAKSRLFLAGRNLMVGAGDETSRATLIWDTSRGSRVASLASPHGPVRDIFPFEETSGSFLLTLSSNALHYYKYST
ncbi:RFWD3 [Cordylochernes scorpioides]|uniref:RING-type E3 ubiquitin transferase n=1 Tax=Cordylochernes scorpioides TaxID=51811 RepID=A0ABY6KE93_9ARAC|nr:RFWD3 [Cordylochernes scorpioides]